MSQAASVITQGRTCQAVVADLSRGGAFLSGAVDLPNGSGVRIAFRLATGLPVVLNGRVVRASKEKGGGVGVQFFDVDDVTHEILNDYLGGAATAPRSEAMHAEVTVKYRLTTAKARFNLTLLGYLERQDCARLRDLIESEAAAVKTRAIVLVIDATQFVCCAPDGLKDFRGWLDALRAGHDVLGGLIGQRTVGVLQLRRIVREAQIADGFMGFETAAEADEVLAHLVV
jgi:hypothetical protein